MPDKITLRITEGPMVGRDFAFEEHDTFLFGRSEECQASLPKDRKVSRHHFILEVNPPDARIRDMGSLNGTYVNDVKSGGRGKGEPPSSDGREYPEVELKDGDRIKVGATVMMVQRETSKFCGQCGGEISGSILQECTKPDGTYICPNCKKKPAAIAQPPKKPEPARCNKCGRDVSGEIGAHRHGDYVCISCKADVMALVKRLVAGAKTGRKDLVAIQGYSIVKELGRGGMGAVYLARHDESGEQVALKIMLPKVAADERAKRLFLRETEVTKALNHPKVVRLKEFGCSDGTCFFTLEFCDGGSVDKLMAKRGGRLSIQEACKITFHVLDGLGYAHNVEVPVKLDDGSTVTTHGVVHRDVSPHNIFLGGSGGNQIGKVADFGLAKNFELAGLSGQTRTGTAMGKPLFMPRQQVINFKYAKPGVDVWAAAASLYNMLSGQYPRDFPRGEDPWRIPLDQPTVPIRKRDPSIPKPLAAVIDLALIDNPHLLVQTAIEFKHKLEDVLWHIKPNTPG